MGGLKTLHAAPLLKSVSSPPTECLEGYWQCFERSVGQTHHIGSGRPSRQASRILSLTAVENGKYRGLRCLF